MIRNLKTLGLALAAIFAFSAVAASGALAQTQGHLTSADGEPFTLTGTEIAAGVNAFTGPFGIEVRCPGSTYAGHKVVNHEETTHREATGLSKHPFINSGETNTTITPTYKNCVGEDGKPRTVDMKGCDYQFDDSTTTGEVPGTYGVTADIVCPAGKEITVTGGTCTIHVAAQTDLTGLHLTNQAGGHILLKGSIPVKAKACGFTVTATQHQDVTIKAHKEDGKTAVGVSISD